MSKIKALRELTNNVNINIHDERYLINDKEPSIYVANHNSILDIFYLPSAIDYDIVSLISSRLIYKKIEQRQKLINKSLNAFPIEAHGGKDISSLCLDYAKKLLINNIDLGIFPEGAYIKTNTVHRGRTGVMQILYSYFHDTNNYANLIPVAINNESSNDDLDYIYPGENDCVDITILPSIDYRDDANEFFYNEKSDKKQNLHRPLDKAMSDIALALGRNYENTYIELFKKGNVIFEDGSLIDTDTVLKDKNYVKKYDEELNKRYKSLVKILK